jgi:hypothetical protein
MSTERYKNFVFRYVRDPKTVGAVRVYVEDQPSYGGRSTAPATIHRWPDNHDGNSHPPYICFKDGSKPTTFDDAQHKAHRWADLTLEYVRTGVGLSEQITSGSG